MDLSAWCLHALIFFFVVSMETRTATSTYRPLRMVVKGYRRVQLNQNAAEPTAEEQTNVSQNDDFNDISTSSSIESGEESEESADTAAGGTAVRVPPDSGPNRDNTIKRIIPDHSDTPYSVADPYKKSAQDNHWHLTGSTTVAVAAVAVALVALIASLGVGAAIMSHKNRLEAAAGILRTEGYVEMLEIPNEGERELCRSVIT